MLIFFLLVEVEVEDEVIETGTLLDDDDELELLYFVQIIQLLDEVIK